MYSAAFVVVMLGVAGFGLQTAPMFDARIGHLGVPAFALLLLYLLAMRVIYRYERNLAATEERRPAPALPLRAAVTRYVAAAAVVVAAAL